MVWGKSENVEVFPPIHHITKRKPAKSIKRVVDDGGKTWDTHNLNVNQRGLT